MSELPAALKARVPTLTEVLDRPELPDLGDDPPWAAADIATLRGEPTAFLRLPTADAGSAPGDGMPGSRAEGLVETVVSRLAPQMEALVSSRLRDVLGPSIQEAVEEAVERCRKPLIEALQAQLREQLEQVLSDQQKQRVEPPRAG